MKKLLFALPVILLVAAGCNSSSTTSQSTSDQIQPAQQTQTNNSATQNTYSGSKFTFKYPSNWAVSSTGIPSKNPTSCGDFWFNASACIELDPSQLAENMANTITVFVFTTNVS